jgi:coenzyme F420-0:L-glutamate ligase / coenzyme F420-1:gamma-L-glutamate ligase
LAKTLGRKSAVLIPVRLPVVKVGASLDGVVISALVRCGVRLQTGDVVAVASKVVSTCENRLRKLDDAKVTTIAKRIARKWKLDPQLATIVLRESNEILGGGDGFLLTIKDGMLTANAGVDLKNCPTGHAMLLPKNSDASATDLRKSLEIHYGAHLAVIIVDSRVTPMRLGTVGVAVGISGFDPVIDLRGNLDVYGRRVKVTRTNVADDLASAAHLLMGESMELIGLVIARNTPVRLNGLADSRRVRLKETSCLIANNFHGIRQRSRTF